MGHRQGLMVSRVTLDSIIHTHASMLALPRRYCVFHYHSTAALVLACAVTSFAHGMCACRIFKAIQWLLFRTLVVPAGGCSFKHLAVYPWAC